jgi:hypothetical protein
VTDAEGAGLARLDGDVLEHLERLIPEVHGDAVHLDQVQILPRRGLEESRGLHRVERVPDVDHRLGIDREHAVQNAFADKHVRRVYHAVRLHVGRPLLAGHQLALLAALAPKLRLR